MTRANNNIHVHCLEGVKRPECPCFDNTLLIKCLIERENNFFSIWHQLFWYSFFRRWVNNSACTAYVWDFCRRLWGSYRVIVDILVKILSNLELNKPRTKYLYQWSLPWIIFVMHSIIRRLKYHIFHVDEFYDQTWFMY